MKRFMILGALALGLVLSVALFNAINFRPSSPEIPAPVKITLDADAAARRLAAALAIPTISHEDRARMDGEAFRQLHAHLEASFPRAHQALNRETISEFSLLYTWPGGEASLEPLVLLAHLDVVPVEAEESWTHGPFSGTIAEGFVWGRGALDDKVGVMAQMEAVERLLERGFKPRRTLYLAYGHDEEVGGTEGAARIAAMLHRLGVRPAMVIDEGGAILSGTIPGLAVPTALIGVAEKGYMSLMFSAEDLGGHASMPPPNTAVGLVARAVARLEAEPMPPRLTSAVRAMLEAVGPHMSFARRLALANLWLSGPLVKRGLARQASSNALVRTTAAATMFTGSPKQNLLPSRAAAVVNFRLLPGDTRESVAERVAEVVDDPRVAISLLPFSSDPSPVSPVSAPAYALIDASVRQVLGSEQVITAPYLVPGATDARWYTGLTPHVYRFRPLRMEPSDLLRLHGTDERIAVANYAEAVRFYAQLLLNVNAVELK